MRQRRRRYALSGTRLQRLWLLDFDLQNTTYAPASPHTKEETNNNLLLDRNTRGRVGCLSPKLPRLEFDNEPVSGTAAVLKGVHMRLLPEDDSSLVEYAATDGHRFAPHSLRP